MLRRWILVLIIGGPIPPILFSGQARAEAPQPPSTLPTLDDPATTSAAGNGELNSWWGRSFDRTSQFILLSGALTSAVATGADFTMRDQWKDHQRMDGRTTEAGDLLGAGYFEVALALGQYVWDRPNGIAHGKSLLGVTVWTTGIKLIAHRKRPGDNPNYNSFPSGHTSTAFTTATSLYYSYGWKVGAPAYLLATGIGLSRMSQDVHWLSDVVAGAFIGIWMGRAYHHNVESEAENASNSKIETRTLWIPSFENDTAFIHVLSQF